MSRKFAVADVDELLRLLTIQARDGNVQAQKALLAHHQRDQSAPPAEGWDRLDELAEKRESKRGRAG